MENSKKLQEKRFLKKILLLFFCLCSFAYGKAQTVNGTVTSDGSFGIEPAIGASVALKGTTTATIVDVNGKYSINVSGPESVLVISFLGSDTQEIKVGNQTTIDVVLKENMVNLGEVLIEVGFQKQKKENLTGAVSAVGAEVFENRPVTNVGQALQGVIPNLNVTIPNGSPGEIPKINLRGGTSIGQQKTKADGGTSADDKILVVKTGSPLILLNGAEISETDFSMLNANDIASISAIKDASASAIYGARAAYGVLLVTTKSGRRNQKAKIGYGYDIQWNKPTHTPDIMDAETQLLASISTRMLTGGQGMTTNEEIQLAGIRKYKNDPSPQNAWGYKPGSDTDIAWYASINPFKESIRDWTPTQKHNISISGGSDKVDYYLSLGFQDQDGFYKLQRDNAQRYNGNLNLNAGLTEWFDLGVVISYNNSTYKEPISSNDTKGSLWTALRNEASRNTSMPITVGPEMNPSLTRTYYTGNIAAWYGQAANQKTKRSTALYSANPTFKLMKDLDLKANLTYRTYEYEQKKHRPEVFYIETTWIPTNAYASKDASNRLEKEKKSEDQYTINLFADYSLKIQNHNISTLVGYNQEWFKLNTFGAKGNNLKSDDVPYFDQIDQVNTVVSESLREWSVRGAFVRLNYNFGDRYLFEMNGRYDGSSRFPKDGRFKFFPSFSGAWRISEEAFMSSLKSSWMDNLKLRASWGAIGNQNIYEYEQYTALGGGTGNHLINGEKQPVVTPPGLISPSFTWETATTMDLGLDFTLLNNRLDFSFDVYQRRTKDVLVAGATYPGILGTESPMENSGILNTKGWELAISWHDKLSNGLRYGASFNLADYRTVVKKFQGNDNGIIREGGRNADKLYTGKVFGEIWGYETDRILQESDFDGRKIMYTDADGNRKEFVQNLEGSKTRVFYPGDILYKDLDGNGIVNYGTNTVGDSGDKKVIGNDTPRLRYGLSLDVSYKGFDLNTFFEGVMKRDVWIGDGTYWGNLSGTGNMEMYNRSWTPERTNAKYPLYGNRTENAYVQSGYLFNGAYLRLKQLVLGYTVPKSITGKLGMDRVRFSISGYNLFKVTDIPDVFDPETVSPNYPQMKSVALGAQITF